MESQEDDNIIVQEKLVSIGCWRVGDWQKQVRIERIGRIDEKMRYPRPVKVTFDTEDMATKVYMRNSGEEKEGVRLQRYRSIKAMRKTRTENTRIVSRWKQEGDERLVERNRRVATGSRGNQEQMITERKYGGTIRRNTQQQRN